MFRVALERLSNTHTRLVVQTELLLTRCALVSRAPTSLPWKEMLYGGVILLAPRLRKHGIEAKARAGLDLLNREIPPPRSCDRLVRRAISRTDLFWRWNIRRTLPIIVIGIIPKHPA